MYFQRIIMNITKKMLMCLKINVHEFQNKIYLLKKQINRLCQTTPGSSCTHAAVPSKFC